jgi:hypothetical protein
MQKRRLVLRFHRLCGDEMTMVSRDIKCSIPVLFDTHNIEHQVHFGSCQYVHKFLRLIVDDNVGSGAFNQLDMVLARSCPDSRATIAYD